MEVEFKNVRPSNEEVLKSLVFYKLENPILQPTDDKGLILKFRTVNEATHEAMKQDLNTTFPIEEKSLIPLVLLSVKNFRLNR